MVDTVGIIGAGQMGSGIAHISAVAGMDVVLSDVSLDRCEAGLNVIKKNMERQVGKGRMTADEMNAAIGRITLADHNKAHAKCDWLLKLPLKMKRSKSRSLKMCANI